MGYKAKWTDGQAIDMAMRGFEASEYASKPYEVIGRGVVGWHAAYENCSSSGGSLQGWWVRAKPAGLWTPAQPLPPEEHTYHPGYLDKAKIGALVYDGKEADARAFTNHVINGPMLNLGLPADAWEKFQDHETARHMATMLQGGFYTLAVAAQNANFRGLDYVGIGVFEGLLRKVPGVRIGRVCYCPIEGAPYVAWEDGSFTPNWEDD